jgi:hypothetical protein
MDDAHDPTEAELAALADGNLAGPRREQLLRRYADSSALREQESALAAIRATADAPAPERLRASVAALAATAHTERKRSRRHGRTARWSLSLGGATVALVAICVLVLAGGEQVTAPSVSEAAARVALAPASPGSPADAPVAQVLAGSIDGVTHPYWADTTGWRATRARRDTLNGHTITTVFYENAKGQRLGYAIAAGPPLPARGGHVIERDGTRMRVIHSPTSTIVTWLHGGHTCILAAHGVDGATLTALAGRSA